ncbi:alpha/beta hydrolase [Candidatus Desantisbacteria bacterium]|nr:alpha/beta hydrolase [Candidatus Desantisbacteria bacterium]
MKNLLLYYATNRKHKGLDRFKPDLYETTFSDDGMENLRFGKVTLTADENELAKYINITEKFGKGDGVGLSEYLTECAKSARIEAFEEKLDPKISDIHQKKDAKFGSQAMFDELKKTMENKSDILIYIHGFNVSWHEAVGSALSLQEMLNNSRVKDPAQNLLVILFTWPSNGQALPFVSYKSDRTDAQTSGYAFARGMLKVRDFLTTIKKNSGILCGQDIHLLCHSMGNYVLQSSLERIDQFTPGTVLPRIFEHIFLCAPDVDDNVFEPGEPMGNLHELARSVSIYHNKEDKAMYVSDYTKGNPERLGTGGVARPSILHNKIQQINCSPLVQGEGFVEHSYYLSGYVNDDIRYSIDGVPHEDYKRRRTRDISLPNVWRMK